MADLGFSSLTMLQQASQIPAETRVEEPFNIIAKVCNNTDRRWRDLTLEARKGELPLYDLGFNLQEPDFFSEYANQLLQG